MERYLLRTRDALKTSNFTSMTLVLGNVSCDLDSAVCSLVYAFYLHWRHQAVEARVCTRAHRQDDANYDIFVPMLNMNREDYELKTEVYYCFGEHNINARDLVFRDDFNLEDLAKDKETKVILVDHHILGQGDKFLEHKVTEILDHRPRDTANWRYPSGLRTVIELVGSCSTLVCSRIMEAENGGEFLKSFRMCADFLYNTIILDTVNFSKEVKKGTPKDEEMVTCLEEILGVEDAKTNRERTLERLVRARSDVSKLTAAQLLRKDVKVLEHVLVPSFPVLVKEVLSLDQCSEALTAELHRSKCKVCVLLGMRLQADRVERDLAVFGLEDYCDMATQLASLLERWTAPPLQLAALPSELSNCQYYQQNNLAASRKQVMPVIMDFLKKHGNESQSLNDTIGSTFSEGYTAVHTDRGDVLVAVRGDRTKTAIITYHDIGLDCNSGFQAFFNYVDMRKLLENFCVYHVNAPGQEEGAPTLPRDYIYPTMDELANQLNYVLCHFAVKSFIGFGVGAGANVLARFAVANPQKVEALALINCTSTRADWTEWGYQKWNTVYLRYAGMTQGVLDYLMWHHFGCVDRNHDLDQVYREHFSNVNPVNLAMLIDSYVARSDLNISRVTDSIKAPVLNVTGALSPHVTDTVTFNGRLNPVNSTWMKICDCGMVLEEEPGKIATAFRLFLQGQGYIR